MLTSRILKNKDGFSAVEVIPVIVIIVLLVNFTVGFFGAIHSGVLNSIAARNYAVETFRHRSDLTYFRNILPPSSDAVRLSFRDLGMRVHSTISENASQANQDQAIATTRSIDLQGVSGKDPLQVTGNDSTTHSRSVASLNESQRNGDVSVNPIWLKISYGICLTAACTTE